MTLLMRRLREILMYGCYHISCSTDASITGFLYAMMYNTARSSTHPALDVVLEDEADAGAIAKLEVLDDDVAERRCWTEDDDAIKADPK